MTARNLGEVENAVFDQVIVETKRGTRGRYWTYIRTGLIVVSDDALTRRPPASRHRPFGSRLVNQDRYC